ncbi:MAG: histidine kinase dimerization/phospho-acceptor domain-containing protein, partial [Candidatus Baltobacteraceae bacterium]
MSGTSELFAVAVAFAAGLYCSALAYRARSRNEHAGGEPEEPQPARPSDERFDALVRALPLGVVMLDRRLRVRFANRAAAAIFGFDRSRVRGTHLIAAVPSIDLENRAIAALRGDRFNTPIVVAGKTVTRTYAVNVYPLTAEPEDDEQPAEVSGILILAEDQTELLALERARQEFLTNVSHELRTPLSSIKLMLETVAQSEEQEAGSIFIPQALAQVDRLASLVQRMLEQARAESGQLVLQIEELDLEQVAAPIVASFEPQAGAAQVNLE